MNLTRIIPCCFFEIDFNIILPLTPGPSKLLLSVRLQRQNSLRISVLASLRVTCPNHLILLDLMSLSDVGWEAQVMKLLFKQFFSPHLPILFFLLGPAPPGHVRVMFTAALNFEWSSCKSESFLFWVSYMDRITVCELRNESQSLIFSKCSCCLHCELHSVTASCTTTHG